MTKSYVNEDMLRLNYPNLYVSYEKLSDGGKRDFLAEINRLLRYVMTKTTMHAK